MGWVTPVPSTSAYLLSMPITPPQVRMPTTGPMPSAWMAALTMSPSEPENSSASATTGPRGASSGYEVGLATSRAGAQPMIRRLSFSMISCEVWPPRFSRRSTTTPCLAISTRRSRWSWAQPGLAMSGTCR